MLIDLEYLKRLPVLEELNLLDTPLFTKAKSLAKCSCMRLQVDCKTFFHFFHSFLDMPLVTKAKSLAAAGACARACCVLSVYVCVNFI